MSTNNRISAYAAKHAEAEKRSKLVAELFQFRATLMKWTLGVKSEASKVCKLASTVCLILIHSTPDRRRMD